MTYQTVGGLITSDKTLPIWGNGWMFQLPISYDCEMSKLKLWSDLSADALSCMNTITMGMRGHLCQGAFYKCKAQSYMTSVSDFIIVWRGFWETIKRTYCSGAMMGASNNERKNDTYQGSNILIYYCVFMIPIRITLYLESISFL
jgi:hypothetical protein